MSQLWYYFCVLTGTSTPCFLTFVCQLLPPHELGIWSLFFTLTFCSMSFGSTARFTYVSFLLMGIFLCFMSSYCISRAIGFCSSSPAGYGSHPILCVSCIVVYDWHKCCHDKRWMLTYKSYFQCLLGSISFYQIFSYRSPFIRQSALLYSDVWCIVMKEMIFLTYVGFHVSGQPWILT